LVVRDGDVPRFTGAKKMSLHQTGFQEVLSAADLLGRYPSRLALIGVQPQDLEDWGGPLTEPVRAALEPALMAARDVLAEWGVRCRPRAEKAAPLLMNDIDDRAYERRGQKSFVTPKLWHEIAKKGSERSQSLNEQLVRLSPGGEP
jgi:hydrogenase maturation protease